MWQYGAIVFGGTATIQPRRISVGERIIVHIGILVQVLAVVRIGDGRIGGHEQPRGRIVNPCAHVDQSRSRYQFMTGVGHRGGGAMVDRMAASLVIFHLLSLNQPTYPSPKGEGFTDPLWGTLKF